MSRNWRSKTATWGASATLALAAVIAGPPQAVADETGPPGNIRVEPHEESFIVEWDPVPGAFAYDVRYGTLGRTSTQETKTTVTGQWGAAMDIRVRTRLVPVHRTPRDVSAWSEPITVTVPFPEGYAPPSAPTNLRPVTDSSGEVAFIDWDRPETSYGTLTYHLHSSATNYGNGVVWTTWSDNPQPASMEFMAFRECIIDPETTYTFWVTATDGAGVTSPPSDPITVRTPPWGWR